jgi:SAM-dependent methyltransferase
VAPVPERISWAVAQLPDAERILEIGCGGGHALALLCARFPRAEIVAIDRSALQAARARARIGEGHARVEELALDDAPAALGAFNAVLAINVNSFWTDPAPSFASLSRLLRPAAAAYLVYEPPSDSRLSALRADLAQHAAAHGFSVDEVRETALRASRGVCLVARTTL